MSELNRGLYETLVTQALDSQLSELDDSLEALRDQLRNSEAPDRLALHLGRVIRRAIESLPDKDRASKGVELARELIGQIQDAVGTADIVHDAPTPAGEVLSTITSKNPDGKPETIAFPKIPLLDTTLLTNSPGEPRVGKQVLTEIQSADRVDIVMAFIRKSGIRPMVEALRKHCASGRALRVLTTTYTKSTELAALEQLAELGAEIRVSYDTSSTRLHAKAWLFHRKSGFSTSYIGSSNLTYSAQIDGLEWNVRVSGARNPDVIEKMNAVFESYWNSGDFEEFDAEKFKEHVKPDDHGLKVLLSPIELRPFPYQERLLEQIELARQQGHHRNLLVSATGTGKTVMAAVDYLRLRKDLDRARLLFVAHRKEILEQTRATFQYATRDHSFGELWVGGKRPEAWEHVFASIQSLNTNDLAHLEPDHFDVVIIDEFHHAKAKSYERLLNHVQPVELLGLTATPERADGLSVLDYFDGRIAAELRLWDAIDQNRLSPFLYYGISDGTDLRKVAWRRGKGYDIEQLTNVLTTDKAIARTILEQLRNHVDELSKIRCLGFCVSVAHARFMAKVFNDAGLSSVAIWGNSPKEERQAALDALADGSIRVIFSVDLFNEGVDLPTVDTVLFLRPTDSATLFLQQLGRGLRKSANKLACTVLDFVGQHRKEFRFDLRFQALLGVSRKNLIRQIEGGFPFLPAGCHMELDAIASKRVIDNIRAAVPTTWPRKIAELRQVAATNPDNDIDLVPFLEESGLELEDVYQGSRSWSDLREAAGLSIAGKGSHEVKLRRACHRLLHIDDELRIDAYLRFLAEKAAPDPDKLSVSDQRLLRMLIASTAAGAFDKGEKPPLADGARLLWAHPQVIAELTELFQVLRSRIDHVHKPLESHPNSPLQIHSRYTRKEILAAFGAGGCGARVAPWQDGVRWVPDEKADLFAFTLDKSTKNFSPTTAYNDYAISPEIIHWESQNSTREDGKTGLRYQKHEELGSTVLMFARLNSSDRAFWFLGPATYISHESERPMQVKWRLKHRLPGDLFASFAAAVA